MAAVAAGPPLLPTAVSGKTVSGLPGRQSWPCHRRCLAAAGDAGGWTCVTEHILGYFFHGWGKIKALKKKV